MAEKDSARKYPVIAIVGIVALALFLIGNLYGIQHDMPELTRWCKYMLMPSLAVFTFFSLKACGGRKSVIVPTVLGILFGWAGDTFLTFSGSTAFLVGMLAFLIGHICYIVTMLRISGDDTSPKSKAYRNGYLFAMLGICVIIGYFLAFRSFDLTGVMGIGVMLYVTAILMVGFAAYAAAVKFSDTVFGYRLVRKWLLVSMFGLFLFVVSDFFLAIDEFAHVDFPNRHFLVMLTYVLGQFLISYGIVRNEQSFTS